MKNVSLKNRLIRLQLTLTMIVLMISWTLIAVNDYFIIKNLLIQNVETTVRILARNLSTCLAFKDRDECQRVLNTLSKEGNTLEARIEDTEKNVISTYYKNGKGQEHNFQFSKDDFNFQFQIDKNIIRTTYPVYDAEKLEGRLFIFQDFDLMETFGKRHLFVFAILLLGSIIIGILVSTRLQKHISEPMKLILSTIHKIRFDKNYTIRIRNNISSGQIQINEFNQLADSFDDMIEQIEFRDKSMRNHTENLEKMVEEKAEKLVRSAELASLGEMAGGIAHEINNPLTIIKSSTRVLNMMMNKNKYDEATFKEYLVNIDQTVERIAGIILGLRNISRRADNDVSAMCCFKDILNDVLSVASEKFNSKGIEIRKNYTDETLTRQFNSNRIQVSQVLVNLLNNAYDAIIDLEAKWVEILIEFETESIYVKITDSGNGIPLLIREKIFNPFYTTKEIGKGTGIGLSISKSMVEKAGGKFYYDNNCANTRFIVQLPNSVVTPTGSNEAIPKV